MSSFPGSKLEDLLDDLYGNYYGSLSEGTLRWVPLPAELMTRVVNFYEPYREELESRLEGFPGDDEASWRDYRNFVVMDEIPRPPEEIFCDFRRDQNLGYAKKESV